jgi:hypothetical protein
MAVSGAPTGRKVTGATRGARSGGGRLARAVGSNGRKKLPLTGGNPSGPHASLISGAKRNGKLPGAD